MSEMKEKVLEGVLLDEVYNLTLAELSRACGMHAEWLAELVEEGILEPSGRSPYEWRFPAPALQRARVVRNLQRDLGVNLAGAALVLDLLDEVERLRARLRRFEPGC
jgi:hypothetical protein